MHKEFLASLLTKLKTFPSQLFLEVNINTSTVEVLPSTLPLSPLKTLPLSPQTMHKQHHILLEQLFIHLKLCQSFDLVDTKECLGFFFIKQHLTAAQQDSTNKEIPFELPFNYVVSEAPHKPELSSNDKRQQKATRLVALFLFPDGKSLT